MRRAARGRGMRRAVILLAILSLLLNPGAGVSSEAQKKGKKNADPSEIGQRDINKGSWNLWSPERELELGQQLATEAERTTTLLRDPIVYEYITELTERIVRNSDSRFPVQVRVVDSGELNAFALPGGYFFIHTGLILEAETEAELTSVIAHEIAHVAARHSTKQMTKARIWNWASIPLFLFGGPVAYAVQQGATLAVPLTFLKFSRNAEREADFLGLQYHYESGYDPSAFVDFFERLKRKEKVQDKAGGIAKVFSTHPMTKDRIVAAERTIEQYLPARESYVVTTSRHDKVRSHLRAMYKERQSELERYGPVLRNRTMSGKGKDKSGTWEPR